MFKRKGTASKTVIIIAACVSAVCLTAVAVGLIVRDKNREISSLRAILREPDETSEPEVEDYFTPVKVDRHYELAGQKILLKDETFGQIWIPVLKDVKLSSHPLDLLKEENSRMYSYDSEGNYNAMTGIDISSHNNVTDWNAVKADGIGFVMLRTGYRTYGGGILHEDEKFKEYYRDAKAAGLKIGAYFFSQATNVEEAVEEAKLTVKQLKDCQLDFPVAFDWEIIFDDDDARTDNIPVDTLTDLTLAYCQNIESVGYRPMIYQNKRTSLLKYDLPRMKGIPFWLAEYGDGPTYIYEYDMWQYSCKSYVDGVEGMVDMNLSFLDFSKPDTPTVRITASQDTDQTGTTETEHIADSTDSTSDSTETEATTEEAHRDADR